MLNSFDKAARLYPHQLGAENTACLSQLITSCADRVHPVPGDIESFVQDRVGTMAENKQTWVSLYGADKSTDGTNVNHIQIVRQSVTVEAALYTYCVTGRIKTEKDLPGNVKKILETPVSDLPSFPTAIIFYSISSFAPGAGANLINRVYEQFTDHPSLWLATLSPLRGLTSWIDDRYGEPSAFLDSKHMRTKLALDYLTANENPVEKFHLKNGAYIGDIKLDANGAGTDDYTKGLNVMVNYVYPNRMQRALNREAYAAGNLIFAPHLYDEISRMGDLRPVRMPKFRPKSPWALRPAMF